MKEIHTGFIRIHVLHHASRGPVYGVWLISELGKHGYRTSPGTLYPMLHKLEEERLLKSSSENVSGRIRRYYTATAKGKKVLAKLRNKIQELIEEAMA